MKNTTRLHETFMNKYEKKIVYSVVLMHHAACKSIALFHTDSLFFISYDNKKRNQLFIKSPNTEAKLNTKLKHKRQNSAALCYQNLQMRTLA